MREIGLSMLTDKGDIKPFNDFMADVRKINQQYNHNYLYAEYNHAVGTSLMAAKWHDFEQDGDRYNLQYRTANDDKVREEHALLHETTLPVNDPFWDKYYPPNGWNCRCTVVQVRKDKYQTSDPALAMLRGDNCTDGAKQKMFRYNPGKTME
ncbi:MAG: minor capsid protein, partial [Bacteroidaceae bacterium]|nr:minor capsid protein [Bacteroidaceae bacterium]